MPYIIPTDLWRFPFTPGEPPWTPTPDILDVLRREVADLRRENQILRELLAMRSAPPPHLDIRIPDDW